MSLPNRKAVHAMRTIESSTRCSQPADSRQPPILTRELLAANGASAFLQLDGPAGRLLTDVERRASLDAFMARRPAGDLWIFAYGSLIWNPALQVSERRLAHVQGWHRSFCLSMSVGRGTAKAPGLALGLEPGGMCHGVAYRIAERDRATELPILWNREMLIGGYTPMWVDVIGADNLKFGSAIAFTSDPDHEHYAGDLPQQEKVRRLATAAGSWGSSMDYLLRTVDGLRQIGIRDREMERLGVLAKPMAIDSLKHAA